MNKIFFVVFLILILGIFVSPNSSKINQEVFDTLENNLNTRVIIELKEPSPQKGIFFKTQKTSLEIKSEKELIKEKIINQIEEKKVKHVFEKSIALEVSQSDLNQLEKNSDIKSIKIDMPVKAFLQDSVPLINASVVWPIQLSNFNITGISETVCIIDTGIDKTHSDLQNKTIAEYCYCSTTEGASSNCCPDNTSEDNNATDNNGHGTHVAGIVAASGGINGVAIGVNIVAIKTLNSTGSGYNSDTVAAIEWCSNDTNIQDYNISIISMSLGGGQYSDYCDSAAASTTNAINTAVGKNISVIAATGNTGGDYLDKLAGIASPACITNSTRISATDKSDNPASYAFRNSNFTDILFAPGSSINSTQRTGGYLVQSGTSMATPHVAGVFALFRQFFILQNNRPPTPAEIKTTLNNTGVLIDDSANSGSNYTRVDIYSALVSIDSSNPSINLISPSNNTFNFSQNITFSCSANDVSLSNLTLYVWNSTAIYNTTFRDITGTNAIAEFNLTDMPYAEYEWNCLSYDANNNFSFAQSNYTLTIDEIRTLLNSPANDTFTNQQEQNFNCSADTSTLKELTNITFFVWNSTDLIYNSTQNFSGISNSTIFTYNLTNETSYYWNCESFNNVSDSALAKNNYTLTYDLTSPNVTSFSPFPSDETSNSVSKIFYYNVTDNYNINNCSLIINNAVSLTNSSANFSLNQNFTRIFTPGTYNWQINCTDVAGNIGNSSTQSFTITASAVVTSSGGSGGGGSSYQTYIAKAEETSRGYTKQLRKNDKVKFTISNEKIEQHVLITNFVGLDYVDITIQSDPINFILKLGEEKKINLTSPEYYNLYIKLNSIKYSKANITFQTIHEEIFKFEKEIPENKTQEIGFVPGEKEPYEINNLKKVIIIITLIITFWIILIVEKKLRKKNETSKTKRKGKQKIPFNKGEKS